MQSNNNKEIKVVKVVESNINNNMSQENTCCSCNNNNPTTNCCSRCDNNNCSTACSSCNDNNNYSKCDNNDCTNNNVNCTSTDNSNNQNTTSKNPFKRILNNLINMFGVSAIKTNKTANTNNNTNNNTNTTNSSCNNNNCTENKNANNSNINEKQTTQESTEKPVEKQKFIIDFKEIKNAKYKNGGKFKATPKWIVVHYTAVIGAGAKSCATSYAKTTRAVSTHFFCDSTDIYRCVDEKHIAWHVGNGTVQQPYKDKKLSLQELVEYGDKPNWRFKLAAENHLKWIANGEDFKGNSVAFGVDLCTLKKDKNSKSVTDEDWYFNDGAIKNAQKCVAYLCHKYNIGIDNVIRHADATGKPCGRPFVSLSGDKDKTKNDNLWFDFKRNVQYILDNYNFDK